MYRIVIFHPWFVVTSAAIDVRAGGVVNGPAAYARVARTSFVRLDVANRRYDRAAACAVEIGTRIRTGRSGVPVTLYANPIRW